MQKGSDVSPSKGGAESKHTRPTCCVTLSSPRHRPVWEDSSFSSCFFPPHFLNVSNLKPSSSSPLVFVEMIEWESPVQTFFSPHLPVSFCLSLFYACFLCLSSVVDACACVCALSPELVQRGRVRARLYLWCM